MSHILVVEDDAELNRTVCTYLGLRGHDCTAALSAAQAYDALYQGGVDLIVSDIMMPGTDGFELAENIRSMDAEIPIIFMTARDDLPSKRRGSQRSHRFGRFAPKGEGSQQLRGLGVLTTVAFQQGGGVARRGLVMASQVKVLVKPQVGKPNPDPHRSRPCGMPV